MKWNCHYSDEQVNIYSLDKDLTHVNARQTCSPFNPLGEGGRDSGGENQK